MTSLGFVLGPLKTAAAVDTGVTSLPAGGSVFTGISFLPWDPPGVPVVSGSSPSPLGAPTRTSCTTTGSPTALPSEQTQSQFLLSLGTSTPASPAQRVSAVTPGQGPRQSLLCVQPPTLPPSPSQSLAPSVLYAPALPGLPGSGHLPTSPRAAPRAPSQACAPVLPRSCVPPLPAFRSLRRWRLLPRPPQLAMPSALGQQWDLVRLPDFCCDTNPAGAVIAQHLAVTTHMCSVAKTCQCCAGPPVPGPCSLQRPVCWGVDGVPHVSRARSRAA